MSSDFNIIIVWPNAMISTTLNINRGQIQSKRIVSSKQKSAQLREKYIQKKKNSNKMFIISVK